ncbi:uncharacterized protein LOC120281389 [Dioscorea cayenensis subsp. rotundata]|uniref:Uncharacterized protein LOC120281389 n=1 Tax=Dioscorea cayennensis subsp. rotundata TaxID=55577 RepID=A0AB40CZ91_DIOCR|nr:uncharacterized protein LOC120281389 [Dioscorea cayenensis subsp. rotundata]
METMAKSNSSNSVDGYNGKKEKCERFKMPLHYPRYSKEEYENMPEWRLDCLLAQYGLPASGGVAEKRTFAMGAFLWTTTATIATHY